MDCQPTATFDTNSLCDRDGCPGQYRPKPTPRISGSTIDIRTELYSHAVHLPKGSGYDELRKHHTPPYAIHVVSLDEDWNSRGSAISVSRTSQHALVESDIYRYGTLLRINPAVGIVSDFSWGVVIQKLVECSVIVSWPSMIMGLIVFTLLGHKSKLLRAAQRKVVTLPELYRSFTYNAISAGEVFQKLDADGDGFLEFEDLCGVLNEFFCEQLRSSCPDETEQWYQTKICEFAELLTNYYTIDVPEDSSDQSGTGKVQSRQMKGISKQDFIDSVLANEPLLWSDMVLKLQDHDCDKGPVDRACIFAQKGLRPRKKPQQVHAESVHRSMVF
jgi:hypothetical protein